MRDPSDPQPADPQPGDFDQELSDLDPGDVQVVEAPVGGSIIYREDGVVVLRRTVSEDAKGPEESPPSGSAA